MAYFQTKGIAVVCGAAGGIGQGAANALAAAGATAVIFADIDAEGAASAAEQSRQYATSAGYRTFGHGVDVRDQQSCEQLVKAAADEVGVIDYYVHAAGVDQEKYAATPDDDIDDYDRVMSINAKGQLLMCRAVLRQMVQQKAKTFTTISGAERQLARGSIVLVTSAMSYGAVPAKVAYGASKHAALGIMRTLAVEHASNNIRVNLVAPTWVRTPMFEGENRKVPETHAMVQKMNPLGRPAEIDEIGSSIVYLCSPASSYMNGEGLILDAGMMKTAIFT